MTKGKKPMFITFEGGEGSGKSSLINRLYSYFENEKLLVCKTREPGGTLLGEQVRHLLLHQDKYPISEMSEVLLFLTSRAQQIKEIISPQLEKGYIVLCDRYNESTIAYQGIARGMGQKETEQICSLACQGLTPDLTFILDVDPKLGLERAKKMDSSWDRMEELDLSFHTKVREAYLNLGKENPNRIHIIDASKNADDVFKETLSLIDQLLVK